MGLLCICLVNALPYTHYVMRSIPRAELSFSRPKDDLTRPPAMVTAKKLQLKKRYPGCLAHAVRGVFYSVVANRRQPNQYTVYIPSI